MSVPEICLISGFASTSDGTTDYRTPSFHEHDNFGVALMTSVGGRLMNSQNTDATKIIQKNICSK